MRQIEDPASEALTVLQALESLARLAWNDDDVREQVAQMDGMHHATAHSDNMLLAHSDIMLPTYSDNMLLTYSDNMLQTRSL